MKKSNWWIIIYPEGSPKPKCIRLSHRKVSLLLGLMGAFLIGSAFLIAIYGKVYITALRVHTVERTNAQLKERIRKLYALEKQLSKVSNKTEKLATILGIKKLTSKEEEEQVSEPNELADLHYVPIMYPCDKYVSCSFNSKSAKLKTLPNALIISTVEGVVSMCRTLRNGESLVKIKNKRGFEICYRGKFKPLVNTGTHVAQSEVIGVMPENPNNEAPEFTYEVYLDGAQVHPDKFVVMGGR